jgi:peptidoglycan/LPS O-acetylase OafA/YrhL
VSAPSFHEFQKKKTFGSLDGLRAISVAGVVWHHVARGGDYFFASQGALGVSLFFAISGFLITTLLLRERRRTGEISLGAFYARRSLRIFPLYYTMLAAYVVVVAFLEHDMDARGAFFANLKYFLTYSSNWFVHASDGGPRVIFVFAWSLATEEQFYLVWPSVEKLLGGKAKNAPVAVALALFALWIATAFDVFALDHASLGYEMLISIAPAICLGVVVAHVLDDERMYRVAALVLGWRWSSPLAFAAMIAWLLAPVSWSGIPITICMALLVGCCVVDEDHALAPILRSSPLAKMGQVSYGVYLMHMLVVNVVEKSHVESRVVVWLASLVATYAVAWVSFTFYESRFLKLKERFTR